MKINTSSNKPMSEEDVIAMIRSDQGDKSLRQYALKMGVSPSYINDIYLRTRRPGEKILRHFGIRVEKKIVVTYLQEN